MSNIDEIKLSKDLFATIVRFVMSQPYHIVRDLMDLINMEMSGQLNDESKKESEVITETPVALNEHHAEVPIGN